MAALNTGPEYAAGARTPFKYPPWPPGYYNTKGFLETSFLDLARASRIIRKKGKKKRKQRNLDELSIPRLPTLVPSASSFLRLSGKNERRAMRFLVLQVIL